LNVDEGIRIVNKLRNLPVSI